MKSFGSVVLLCILMLGSFTAQKADEAPSLEVELRRAVQKELASGDVKASIEEYRKIARRAEVVGQRAVTAEALLRMGVSYQKLGNPEAGTYYERVAREFGDLVPAATARDRLRKISPSSHTAAVIRSVLTDVPAELSGGISPDGRLLSYVDGSGDLAVHSLVTRENRNITRSANVSSFAGGYAGESVFSKDGKHIAFGWFDGDSGQLRIATLDESITRDIRVVVDNPDLAWMTPHDWSPDGRLIAVQIERKDKTSQLGLFDVRTGALATLKSLEWRGVSAAFFSPDGKYIVYDQSHGPRRQRDVFILSVDGSRAVEAVPAPGDDFLLGWTPDGKQLVFGSDRTGTVALWSIQVIEGRTQGSPTLIKTGLGSVRPLGTTSSGALYLTNMTDDYDVQLGTLDAESGVLVNGERPLKTFVHANTQPDWSPDGTELAYKSRRSPLPYGSPVLGILTLASGEIRELQPDLSEFNWPRWAPDGHSFVVQGTDTNRRQGIFRIDAHTGKTSPILFSNDSFFFAPLWAPDGQRVFFSRNNPETKDVSLVELNLASGHVTELLRRASLSGGHVSPDGKYLAVNASDPSTRPLAS
jgi:Tol biopolymer transport system component